MTKEPNDKSLAIEGAELKTRVVLLNRCTNCGSKFKPVNSRILEKLCGLCLREKQNQTEKIIIGRDDF